MTLGTRLRRLEQRLGTNVRPVRILNLLHQQYADYEALQEAVREKTAHEPDPQWLVLSLPTLVQVKTYRDRLARVRSKYADDPISESLTKTISELDEILERADGS